MHILGSVSEGHLSPDRGEDPAEGYDFDRYLAAYRDQMETLGIERSVVVQSLLHGTDLTLARRGIEALGRDRTRGIGLVENGASDHALDVLLDSGFEGVRLSTLDDGMLGWEGIEEMAPRLADRGLHVQMLLRADRDLVDLAPQIAAMPVEVVLDHLAMPDLSAGPDAPGFRCLLDLLEHGKVWLKLTGGYRVCPAPFDALDAHVAAALSANPLRCLWGSDWPQTMLNGAARAEAGGLLDAFDRVCPDDHVREAVLVKNPARLYGF